MKERRKFRKKEESIADRTAKGFAKNIADAFIQKVETDNTLLNNLGVVIGRLEKHVENLDIRTNMLLDLKDLMDRAQEQMQLTVFDKIYTPASLLRRKIYSAYTLKLNMLRSFHFHETPNANLTLLELDSLVEQPNHTVEFELGYARALQDLIKELDGKFWEERANENPRGGRPDHRSV